MLARVEVVHSNDDSSHDSRADSCHERCTVSRNVYPPSPDCFSNDLEMSYYYVPRPPREHMCLLPVTCFTPQPPEVYYQPPPQEYIYHPPPEKRVYQPPPQTCVYRPPPQICWYQPPAQTYEYQPPPQKYMYQSPPERYLCQDGDARMFRELGIPGRDFRRPTLF